MKKLIYLLVIYSSIILANENTYTIKAYKSNTFFALKKIKLNNITKILPPSRGCILFQNNTNIYCDIKNKRKIKIKLRDKKDNIINLLIINEKYLAKNDYYIEDNVKIKYKKSVEKIKELESELIIKINSISNLENDMEKLKNIIKKQDENLIKLKDKIKKEKFNNKNTVKEIEEKCEKERTELLSILRGKKYKKIGKYSINNQLIMELEEERKNIKEIQHEYLQALKNNEKLKDRIKYIKSHSINSSNFYE